MSYNQDLYWLRTMGVGYYYSDTKVDDDLSPLTINLNITKSNVMQNNSSSVNKARRLASAASTIEELKDAIMNFDECAIKFTATNTVFADGTPFADVMLIGEAPGATEDKMGIPFCGESGKLLDNMLASINISRNKNAYITNTVFWRPPANRTPTNEEIETCKPFVERHISLIQPKLIIMVGATAATSLLGQHAGITNIRQEYYKYTNEYLDKHIWMTGIFHPAYLLRQPSQKKTSWYDLIKIREFIDSN